MHFILKLQKSLYPAFKISGQLSAPIVNRGGDSC